MTDVAEFIDSRWVVEFLAPPEEAALVVIERPSISTWASPDFAICANCEGEIWQARRRKNWRSNVCDTCYRELISPSKKTVTIDYNSDGSVRTAADRQWWQTDYHECTGQCTPARTGLLTGAAYVLGLWRDY